MQVVVLGGDAGHCDRPAADVPRDDGSAPESGSRLLQWIGLVAVAAAAGVVLAFGAGPATEAQAAVTQAAQTTQVAQPPPSSSGGKRDAWLDKIRDLARKAKDPAVRKLAKEYLDFADRFPTTSCMSQCFLEALAQDDSPGAKSLVKHLMNCSAKCLDKEDFKRKLAEWHLDRGQREKLSKAEEAARNAVRDLTRKVNEGRASQDQLDKARKDLAQAVEARKNYERARALQEKADRFREQAGKAGSTKERDRLLRAAERKEQQATNVREGRDKNDDGPGRAGPKDGDSGGRTSARVPRWLKKLFGAMGYVAIGSEILDEYLQGKALLNARYLAALKQLHDYVERHPYEADELAPLFQQNELPLLDPDRMAEFLRDWDANHDDLTGDETTSWCEKISRLGGGYCGPEPASQERLDPRRGDQHRTSPVDDRRPALDGGPDRYRPDPYQPDRHQPDVYQPYQPGPAEVSAAEVVVVEPDDMSAPSDSDRTSEKRDDGRSDQDSSARESSKSKKTRATGTSRSSTSTSRSSTSTGKSTGKSTGRSTGTDTGRDSTKQRNTAPSDLDRARDELAREKSPQAKADQARDALAQDKKAMSDREKL